MEEQAVVAKRRRDECKEDKSETHSDNLTRENNEHLRETRMNQWRPGRPE